MSYFQVNDRCNGCLACVQNCPARALDHTDAGDERTLLHNMARCARCATCWRVCPQDAIEFEHLLRNRWDQVATLPLMRCAVCGQPVYTHRWKDSLEKTLSEMVEPLCPRHQAERAFLSRAGKPAARHRPGRGKTS
jgi:ferredoxin